MAWHLQLGYDEGIMKKVDAEDSLRQKYIFSMLTLMLLTVGLMVFFSAIVYMVIIFHSWLYAIIAGLFLGLIVFNIYRFLIVSSVNATQSGLAGYHISHDRAYVEHIVNNVDFSSISDESIAHYVNAKKEDLRQLFNHSRGVNGSQGLQFWTMFIRVSFIAIFAVIFATGIELFLFRDLINTTLDTLKEQLTVQAPDSFLLKHVLTPPEGSEFIGFHSNSLLILLEILNEGIGYWKLLIDLIILTVFLIPLVLVFKSREILLGDYVRELALHEISISHFHYLKSQKYCAHIIQQIQNDNISIVA